MANESYEAMPVATLTSGLMVGNFSSPHVFNFDTGETLENCSISRSVGLQLDTRQLEESSVKGTLAVSLEFMLSKAVLVELEKVQAYENVDIILVPFPMLEAMKKQGMPIGKCRAIVTVDRITKAVSSTRFAV